MGKYKGVGVVFMRRLMRETGVEAAVLAHLDDNEKRLYDTTTSNSWVPVELATKLFELSAPLIYPTSPNPIREVGRALGRDNLSGVYRFLVRLASVQFVVGQGATLWRTYHDTGHARAVQINEKTVDFVVADYPALPERFRECMAGWVVEITALTGGQNVRVVRQDTPEQHVWHVTWR